MPEISLAVDVDATPERVWDAAVDWERQHEWMVGTTVEGGRGLGATLVAFTGWRGIGFRDPMTITAWDPPRRCVVRHDGRVVRGTAAFEVVPLPDGRARFVWTEWLTLGFLGELGWPLVRPLVLPLLRRSMDRFAVWASTRGTSAVPSPGTTSRR